MDWYIWRVLTAEKLTVSMADLHTTWSLEDLADAHDVLDLLDELADKSAIQQQIDNAARAGR